MKLVEDEFIPCMDEVWRLRHLDEPDCKHFQKFCDEGGHLNGDGSNPDVTRQGTYVCTPSGTFLGAINTRSPAQMLTMLREALKKWKDIPKDERLLKDDPKETKKQINRSENHFPEDGLALRVHSRDLPRDEKQDASDWRTHALNVDFCWFKKAEMEQFLPKAIRKKATVEVPRSVLNRLRFHVVDNVRGQTNGYPVDAIQELELTGTVTKITRKEVTIGYTGKIKMEHQNRGVDATMRAEVKWSIKGKKFSQFDLVVIGDRFGRTTYNARADDTDRAPIGWVFTLTDPEDPTDRVAPAQFGGYNWN